MRRRKRPSLRGSVTQNNASVRLSANEPTRLGLITRFGLLGGGLLLIGGFGLWAWQSGWAGRQMDTASDTWLSLTQKAHFNVAHIDVTGRSQTSKDQLTIALNAATGSPILGFDPHEAAARVSKLPWVESVTVMRRLPDTITVRIKERVPLARWQINNKLTVVDAEGKALPDADPERFRKLPLIVGAGAAEEAKPMLDALHDAPAVENETRALVRVSNRRWDVHLSSGAVARLPESNVEEALKQLALLITEQNVLERGAVSIDLRLPDRLIIESNSPPVTPPTGKRL